MIYREGSSQGIMARDFLCLLMWAWFAVIHANLVSVMTFALCLRVNFALKLLFGAGLLYDLRFLLFEPIDSKVFERSLLRVWRKGIRASRMV